MYPALGNIRAKRDQNTSNWPRVGRAGGNRGVQLSLPFPFLERPAMTTPSEAVEIYCVKCRAKTASKDIEAVTMKNGRAATRSTCVDCGTRKFRIGVLP